MSRFSFADEYKSFFLSMVRTARMTSGGKEINCRCFECGDSIHQSSAHMYISLPTPTEASFFYCHKCNTFGMVTYKKLIEWGIYDSIMGEKITEHNATVMNTPRYRKYDPDRRFSVRNDRITMDDTTNVKMSYINNRLGINFTPQDFLDYKIVLNLKDFLNANNIHSYTREFNIISDLDRAFVGFLSLDNGFITLRKLDDEKVYKSVDKRYVNYRIFDKEDTSERFYTIPTRVDLMSPGNIKLHIAEGAFDILSIYLNLRNKENGIYTSVSGSNYIGIVFHFLLTAKIPNIEIHLYPDNDKQGSGYKMNKIGQVLRPLGIPIYIHRNMASNEKDFGVSLDRINEVVTPLR